MNGRVDDGLDGRLGFCHGSGSFLSDERLQMRREPRLAVKSSKPAASAAADSSPAITAETHASARPILSASSSLTVRMTLSRKTSTQSPGREFAH